MYHQYNYGDALAASQKSNWRLEVDAELRVE